MGQIQAALSESVGVCACEGISGNSAVRTTARCQLRARFKGCPQRRTEARGLCSSDLVDTQARFRVYLCINKSPACTTLAPLAPR